MPRMPDLDDALQDLSEVVARRLVLLDEAMRVISYSIHESDLDRERLSHILAHSDSWAPPRTATVEHVVESVPSLGDCVFLRLEDRGHRIVGHLMLVLDGRPPRERDLDHLRRGSVRLGALLSLRKHYAERDLARARALTVDLVTGSPAERADAADALIGERILSASGRYCAVALGVDPRTASPHDAEKSALAVALTLNFVAETSTASVIGAPLDEGQGVLVFPRPVVVPRLTRILERRQVIGVRAGIGPLVELAEVHRSFARAQLAWRSSWLAPQDHPIVLGWDETGLDGTLARLPLEDLAVEDLPPTARRVIDAGLDLDMLATLDCHLNEGGDAQRAARELNIHRSTLYYRLEKMREAIGGELRDGQVRRELHTGLRMAQLARLGPWRHQ